MKTNDTITNEEEWNYNTTIKKRLIAWRKKFEKENCNTKINYGSIAQKMEEDFHIRTSPQKISAMFDTVTRNVYKYISALTVRLI